ncbi:hypothetical protein KR100_01465 [Synechococcus sp. KORDI-100]|uniref:TIGR04372 family glycosyltransferase n=1 Tax=Synechococcus sp. KORDI-100 TaxID=1280380 RepID=UPI0004E057ED|nr:TIGR04372 family glycosyltransferase [Synechococcus sp. KORDI-100]AII42075.1 hypothetical protein KR100_01465 [Synechococcus sp. KORDI-100]
MDKGALIDTFAPDKGSTHRDFHKLARKFDLIDVVADWLIDYESVYHSLILKGTNKEPVNHFEDTQQAVMKCMEDYANRMNETDITTSLNEIYQIVRSQDIKIAETLKVRLQFNIKYCIKCLKYIYLDGEKVNKNMSIVAMINILFLCKNFACSNLGNKFIASILETVQNKFDSLDDNIRSILWTAWEFSTTEKNKNVLEVQDRKVADMSNQLRTRTGSSLYAFGHLLTCYENLIRLSTLKNIDQIHEIFLSPSNVANSALALLLIEKAEAMGNNVKLYKTDRELIKGDKFKRKELLPTLDNTYMLNKLRSEQWMYNEEEYKRCTEVSKNFWQRASNELGSQLYTHRKRYACLYLRDNTYKREPDEEIHLNSDRNSHPSNYEFLPDLLDKYDLDLIRTGEPGQPKMETNAKNYFEYNRSKFKCDLNDIYLLAMSEFYIVGGYGGGATASGIFNIPVLYLNFPLTRRGFFNPYSVIVPLRYYKDGRELSINEILEATRGGCHDATALIRQGITWKEQNSEVIKNAVKKFMSCVYSEEFFKNARQTFDKIKLDSDRLLIHQMTKKSQEFSALIIN